MPDFGLTKALARGVRAGVRRGAKGAKVLRPAELEVVKQEAVTAPRSPTLVPAMEPETAPAPVAPKPQIAPDVAPASPVPDVQATAERLSGARLGDYSLDETYQTNFDVINTGDDIKAVIADLAHKNRAAIEAARGQPVTHAELEGLARDADVPVRSIQEMLDLEAGQIPAREAIVGTRAFLNASAARIKRLGDAIATGQATDVEKIQFARQIQLHNAVNPKFMRARAEWGRAGHAFAIPVGADATQVGRMSELIGTMGGDIDRLAKVVHMVDSVPGITQAVKAGVWRRTGRAVNNIIVRNFVNGILSGPPTHIVNVGSNIGFPLMNVAETAVATRLGRFLPGEEHFVAGEASATLSGLLGGTRDAWRLAWRTLKTGRTLDDVLRFDATGRQTTLDILPELDMPILGRVIKIAEAVIDAPTKRLLAAEDEFFKTLAYRGDIQRRAFLHVHEQVGSGAITADEAERVAREFMENAPEEAQKAAEDWAREMTFQNPLGPVGQKVQAIFRHYPLLSLIAPFIRTPTNIFKQSAYRSPMAPLTAKFWHDLNAGGRRRDMAITRFVMGSTTSALIASWVAEGRITGAGPSQPEARMIWEGNGRRPYSALVTNPDTGKETYESYARLEPLASVIGSTADAVTILSYLNDDVETLTDEEQLAYQAAAAIVAGVANNTTNKTFTKGIADFTEFMSSPTQHIKPYLSQMVAAQVPYSSALRFVRNTRDPYLREAWTILDKIKDNIPGYSEDLPVRRGLFGELREKGRGSLLGPMSPMPSSEVKYDPVVAELNRIMEDTRVVPITMPGKRIEGMRLDAREYEQFVRASRIEPIFDDETLTFHEKLAEVMESDLYQDLQPLGRVELLKQVQRDADAVGRYRLEENNEPFAQRLALHLAKKARLKYGELAE